VWLWGELHPHHIIMKSIRHDLVFDINNGITLCIDCHYKKGVHVNDSKYIKIFQDKIIHRWGNKWRRN